MESRQQSPDSIGAVAMRAAGRDGAGTWPAPISEASGGALGRAEYFGGGFPCRGVPARMASYNSRFSMAEVLAVGAVVRLKSGGPAMTVTQINSGSGTPSVSCHWFAGTEAKFTAFNPNALEAAKPDVSPR